MDITIAVISAIVFVYIICKCFGGLGLVLVYSVNEFVLKLLAVVGSVWFYSNSLVQHILLALEDIHKVS